MEDEIKANAPTQRAVFANGLVVTQLTNSVLGKPKTRHVCRGKITEKPRTTSSNPASQREITLDYGEAVKEALDLKLKELTEQKRRAQAKVPLAPGPLSMALQMPRVLKSFRFITYRRLKYELTRCFCIWYNTKVYDHYVALGSFKEKSIVYIQRSWRGYIARLHVSRRKQREAKKMVSAVNVVKRLYKVYRLRKAIKARIKERQDAIVFPTATAIQSIVRLYLGRRAFLLTAKRELYRELRLWSGGRVDSLLRRPGLQDLETQYLIISAVNLATGTLKDSITKHGLRLRLVILKYLRLVRERRLKAETTEEIMKLESILMLQNQAHMLREDKLAILVSCFDYQTHAREQRKAQQRLEELERHRAENAASSERRAQQLKASLKINEAKVEQKERELMYFSEFHQRAVEWKIKDIENSGCAAEAVKMIKEDQLSRAVGRKMREDEEKRQVAREQLEKIVNAKIEGIRLRGGDGARFGRKLAERNFADKGNDINSINDPSCACTDLLSLNIDNVSKSERSASAFHEIRPQLASSLRISCRLSGGPMDQMRRFVLLNAVPVTEARYVDLFAKINTLSNARLLRRNNFRYLREALAHFERDLARLNYLRHLNRTVKFESKNDRHKVLNEAVFVERRLTNIQNDAENYGTKLVSILKEEVENFQYIFLQGGQKDFVYAHSPHLFKLKATATNIPKAGSRLQQKKKNGLTSRRASKIDIRISEPSPKNAESNSIEGEITKTTECWFHESEEFMKNRVDIDEIDRKYYSAIENIPFMFLTPPTLDFTTPPACTTGKVPGLSKFIEPDANKYGFYKTSLSVIKWVSEMVSKMTERERIWKCHYRNQLISFYQRMFYVCNTETILSTTSSAAMLNPHDITAPHAIDSADVLDLYELLCCRISVKLTGLELQSGCPFELKLSSFDCEHKFGMHPFSMVARYIYLLNYYESGKKSSVASVSDVSSESSFILGGKSSYRRRVAEAITYNPIFAPSNSIFDNFDSCGQVTLASRNEFAEFKLLALELVQRDYIYLSQAIVSLSPESTRTAYGHSATKKRQLQKNNVNDVTVPRIRSMSLLIKKAVDVNSFLQVTITNDDFNVNVMPWMCPIHHWGSPAEPEPVWRRIAVSDVVSMLRSLPKQTKSEPPKPRPILLPKSVSMKLTSQKRNSFQGLSRRKIRSGPLKNSNQTKVINISSLSQIVLQISKKTTQRPKRETRLLNFEDKMQRWSRNVFNFLKERVRIRGEVIAQASEIERERQFRVLESDMMTWEDSLGALVRIDGQIKIGKLSTDPPDLPSRSCFSFIFPQKHVKVAAEYGKSCELTKTIEFHRQVLQNVPDTEVYKALRFRVFEESELCILKQLFKQRTLGTLREDSAYKSTCYLGNQYSSQQSVDGVVRKMKRITKLKLLRRSQLVAKKAQKKNYSMTDMKWKEVVKIPIVLAEPMLSVAESWVCGGCNAIFVICRVVFDSRRNPRGELRSLSFKLGEETALHARCGFVTRKLCDDRGDRFAVTMSYKRFFLSDKALMYLRGTDKPLREQPTLEHYCRNLCTAFFHKKSSLISEDKKLLEALVHFQLKCKAKLQKMTNGNEHSRHF